MGSGRLEAFSDGVLAIIITIMVLELKPPHESTLEALRPVVPKFLSYLLSFVYIGIYWNNHHHLFQAVRKVEGWTLWANLHLLFWLSLVPFTTAWMGETSFGRWPTAAYGLVLLAAAVAYMILQRGLVALHGRNSLLAAAVANDFKERLSLVLYAVGVAASFFLPLVACIAYLAVALVWLKPDHRIERKMNEETSEPGDPIRRT
jgi:uncharacterized membrane protein